MYYIFDGSYYGLLTCVFEAFSLKEYHIRVQSENRYVADMFGSSRSIDTDVEKAKRILVGLRKKMNATEVHNFFRAYLAEDAKAYQCIFNLIVRGFMTSFAMLEDFGNADVLYLSNTLKQVGREHHRMKAFVRFQKSNDGLYYALVDPDFNVLPLLASFFKNRYADQRWMIYDTKRNYGLMYDLKAVVEVQAQEVDPGAVFGVGATIELDNNELKYQRLWQQYFKSTTIEARKNLKLHIQHVPKRYWKYLTEKQG